MKQLCLIVVSLLLIGGCASTHEVEVRAASFLNDDAFPKHQDIAVESEQQVFALDNEAQGFVRRTVSSLIDPVDQMESLVRAIFDRSDFNLLYMGSANTTAMQTFHSRAANCLSLSIMTYAMAKEAGFSVRFQDIEIPEYWTRRDGYSLLNGHVNLRMVPRDSLNVMHLLDHGYEVDFDPQSSRKHFKRRLISKTTVLAMFYNNKGADALLSEDYDRAYAYFKQAVSIAPEFGSTWVNLGFLYRLTDHYEFAERSYLQALNIQPDNLTATENLAYLYDHQGKAEKASEMLAIIDRRRADNPFYHFILGEQEFDNENWQGALQHYRDALRLDKSKHEIYYGLAKTYYQLGDISRSQRYFRKAKNRSRSEQDQERYQGKLDFLSRL